MLLKYTRKIKEVELFKSLSQEDVFSLLKNGDFDVKKYAKGSIIHMEDELCDKIEIILSGKVVIDSLDESGKYITITDFVQGDILGGNLIFSSHPYYPMTITSLTETRLCRIRKLQLVNMFGAYPEFLMQFLKMISDNTYILSRKIKNSINKSLREKIILFLLQQQKIQASDEIILKISKKKIAEKMGVQRTSLSRELKKMQDEGMIIYDRDCIKIINLGVLNEDR